LLTSKKINNQNNKLKKKWAPYAVASLVTQAIFLAEITNKRQFCKKFSLVLNKKSQH